MPLDKADSEVQVGGSHDLRKRCALVSASVLLVTAGAIALYRNTLDPETALAAAGAGLRRLQGRRLPHYTTYGGTSYDFAPKKETCCCTQERLSNKPTAVGEMMILDIPVESGTVVGNPGTGLTRPIPVESGTVVGNPGTGLTRPIPVESGTVVGNPGTGLTVPIPVEKGTVVGNPGTGFTVPKGYENPKDFGPPLSRGVTACVCTPSRVRLEQPMMCKMTIGFDD